MVNINKSLSEVSMDSDVKVNKQANEPGSAQYGNFINYYQFNSAENRIELLPTFIWEKHASQNNDSNYVVLDIGCNAGNLTQILYPYLSKHTGKNVHIFGIDIDSHLIERCIEHNQHKNNVRYKCLNIMEWKEDNVMEYLKQFSRTRFDAIFSLSLTMWLHINNGDDGLNGFLNKISNLGNLLVVEPQPWKCYLTAVRRMRRSGKNFEKFNELKVRNNVENWIKDTVLREGRFAMVFETIPTQWNRKISFYERINDSSLPSTNKTKVKEIYEKGSSKWTDKFEYEKTLVDDTKYLTREELCLIGRGRVS